MCHVSSFNMHRGYNVLNVQNITGSTTGNKMGIIAHQENSAFFYQSTGRIFPNAIY